jgi:hypothetical protein
VVDRPGDGIRSQIALLCRRRHCRSIARNLPCRWYPTTVINQSTGLPYNDGGAFEAIAEAIDRGVPMTTVVLREPPGKTAYEMLIPQIGGRGPIYVKVQLGAGQVLARSFHYSDYAEKEL